MRYGFDLDGTLLNHPRAALGGLRVLCEQLSHGNLPMAPNIEQDWLQAERKHYARYEAGEISFQEQRRERLRSVFSEYCQGKTDAELDKLYQVFTQGYQQSWQLYEDVLPTLSALQDDSMALITNGDSSLQRAKIRQLNLDQIFSSITVSGEFGAHKPDPRIFLKACADLGVEPNQVAYVGDNFQNDIEGSCGAGLEGYWLNRESLPRPSVDFNYREIRSLSELLS